MKPPYITADFLQQFISCAFAEDIGDGDHSSLASIPATSESRAKLLIKDTGVLAGVELALDIFKHFDTGLQVQVLLNDGASVRPGDIAFNLSGKARSILATERLVLNCMQRMSGIATYTHKLVALVSGTRAKILDTRKTTPNFRLLEKWAVHIGGGTNHRIGLFDMIMLKDNHIDMAGGIEAAIFRTKEYLRAAGKPLRIEVETRNLDEVRAVLHAGGVDVIMLDNFTPALLKEAVAIIGGACQTEASGGITEQTICEVAATGVDFISVVAHPSVRSLDLSLKAY
ncbi:MAG: carboxylating nicotinate-nucleotide diphosphorylase [Bacteroidia bacterium]|nr:carboxylating nicotinate-nucleotide diphosphorylase [Bacteroidia bacterium]